MVSLLSPTAALAQKPPEAAGRDPAISVKPGSGVSFRDCSDCPEMVVVPAGSFMMGSPPREEGRLDREGPQRQVTIARPIAVGKFEVTFEERGKRPVINVSWDDITGAYLPWLSRKSGKAYRLLSEAEWEFAARADNQTKHTWGDEIGTSRANCDGRQKADRARRLVRRQCIWPSRHARQRLGVGGGLLA